MSTRRIGRYEIRSELGRGGMATVFLAHDPLIGRDVAVKVLPREFLHDPSFRGRFEREARTIAMLEHPAIVPIYDFGEQDGQPFLVMRYMKGGTLADRLTNGPASLDAAASILKRIGAALDHAHKNGVIHRDLKPGNILFDEYDLAFLSDFGIVKLAQETVTFTGDSLVGTPAYMSPEQVHGRKKIDGRSDIYTLGLILFEMLAGEMPFRADTPAKIMMAHVMEPIPPILEIRPDLPAACNEIVSRALAKEPEERFQTGDDLAEALRETAESARLPGRRTERAPSKQETALDRSASVGPAVRPPAQVRPPEERKKESPDETAAATAAAPAPSARSRYFWPALGAALFLALCCGGIAFASAFFPGLGGALASENASPPPAVTTVDEAQQVDAPGTAAAEAAAVATSTAAAVAASEDATATRAAQRTATAEAQAAAIATRIMESTVTAEARQAATATAYAPTRRAEEAVQAVLRAQRNDPVFGPSNGNLVHAVDGFIKSEYAGLDVRNFVADAVFYSPYAATAGTWDIGFLFRETDVNDQFRLTVESNGDWSLTAQEGDAANVVNRGAVNNLNTGEGGANRLTLLADGGTGYLFVNGRFVAELDLSRWNVAGDVGVGTSFYEGNEIEGEATAYEEFTVWSPQGE